MRFKLTLERQGTGRFLPMNYQYELSSAIYRVVETGDSAFSQFLHDQGYLAQGKPFRLFAFSQIKLDRQRAHPTQARLEHLGSHAELQVSFLVDRIAEEFVKGVFMGAQLYVGDAISGIAFTVVRIESVGMPLFLPRMRYRCLSPILVKEKRGDGGENYLSPQDPGYADLLHGNLCAKLSALALSGNRLDVGQEGREFSLQILGKVHKKGVLMKQLTAQQTKLIGYVFEFELIAPVELQEIGYYAGFGNLNSQGFGCVELR